MSDLPNNGNLSEAEIETQEWLESLDYVLKTAGPERARELIEHLRMHAQEAGANFPVSAHTPYNNTIPPEQQPRYPGDREMERRIKSIIRWNAMAMVVRANRADNSIGGHISTYASSATLYEVGFNHFFKGKTESHDGDLVYFQGHASPGMYSRAFLEDRLNEDQLDNFRRELQPGGGLSSYPHPWLMPDFWQFPTVSMGLGPIMAIYQARFARYLENRGLKPASGNRVWAFLGDGEMDEPESLGAIDIAVRENLDNLTFVINCNLQRLDGPVRGNGKIIQELEGVFRGAGWNVIKVIWGSEWDLLFAKDTEDLLIRRLDEIVDGEYQKYSVEDGAHRREHMFGTDPRLLKMVSHLSDEDLENLRRGGHDPLKVYAAYKSATEFKGAPTVILVKTIKGYGLGEGGEGRNVAHNQKKLDNETIRHMRDRFDVPIPDDRLDQVPFYKPAVDSPEMQYLHERRKSLGGYLPQRKALAPKLKTPAEDMFEEFYEGTHGREASTTMVFVRILSKLLRDKTIGNLIVPIVPDESRTFGMESLFRQCGIYAPSGQLYIPVDSNQILYYREAKDGQFMQEGISEAGSMSTFISAGTAYANYGINTIPFFTYYSMFGFQRIGDLAWAAADLRCKGFMMGGTSGRTTLNGEGLQHQDGHSHLLAATIPTVRAYDPAFAFELAIIIRHGIYEMYEEQQEVYYYITVHNENYAQPAIPEDDGVKDGIVKGIYKFRASQKENAKYHAHLFGSGAIMNHVLKAQEILEEKYDVAAHVWSVTSYSQLRRDALNVERWNMLHPNEEPKESYLQTCFENEPDGVFVASSDYLKILPDGVRPWIPGAFTALGTDGFGRSETRGALRDFFEVDERYVALAALTSLARQGHIKFEDVDEAVHDLEIDPEKLNPMLS